MCQMAVYSHYASSHKKPMRQLGKPRLRQVKSLLQTRPWLIKGLGAGPSLLVSFHFLTLPLDCQTPIWKCLTLSRDNKEDTQVCCVSVLPNCTSHLPSRFTIQWQELNKEQQTQRRAKSCEIVHFGWVGCVACKLHVPQKITFVNM